MDLSSFTPLEGLLIAAVCALASALAVAVRYGFKKLLKGFNDNTAAFTSLNGTLTQIAVEQRDHRQVDLEIANNLGAIRAILQERD